MRRSFNTLAGVVIAAGALATGYARASAIPSTHWFVKGEHFTYETVISFGGPAVIVEGPQRMTATVQIDVRDVSATAATLVYRVKHDAATGFSPEASTIRATPDGTWRFEDGRIAENVATWDPAELGAPPATLTAGQHWAFDVGQTQATAPAHAEVRIVAADGDDVRVHVDGTIVKRPDASAQPGQLRTSDAWTTDVTFRNGVVRERRRVDTTHIDRGPGSPGVDNKTERTTRLIEYTRP